MWVRCQPFGASVTSTSHRPKRSKSLLGFVKCLRFAYPSGISPRRSQLKPGLIERGTFRLKRLHRAAVIAFCPWNGSSDPEPQVSPPPKESRDPLKLARYYQSLMDSGYFENRAALARYLGVSRARVTQVLKRLTATSAGADSE